MGPSPKIYLGPSQQLQVLPGCKIKHSELKDALETSGKLRGDKLGIDQNNKDLVDGLFNQMSLSFRVLLLHYRLCVGKAEKWPRAKRCYKGNEDLAPVEKILGKIELDDEDEEDQDAGPDDDGDEEEGESEHDWLALQASSPHIPIWEVGLDTQFQLPTPSSLRYLKATSQIHPS